MRIFILALVLLTGSQALAQQTDTTGNAAASARTERTWNDFDFTNRANDHLMIQFGYDGWMGAPDSIRTTGIGRHFNVYGMYDMPFKTNPHWSVAIGAGIGSSNIYFDKMSVDIAPNTNQTQVVFHDRTDTSSYKKFKLATVHAQIPVELRWVSNPYNTNKSWKIALGAKVGTLISATAKGKNLQSSNGTSIHGGKYIMKEKERSYFNGTSLAATLRFGYGVFTLHGQYHVMPLFKEGQGPVVRPFSVGLTISGL